MSIIEMRVPTIGESITEVTLSQWLIDDGSYVKIDQPICEFESDKATLEFPAEASGKLIYMANEDDDLEIGALVAKIDTSVEESLESVVPDHDEGSVKNEAIDIESKDISYASNHPSPSAAKLIRENEIDKTIVKGTGKDGRILKIDVQKIISESSVVDKEKNKVIIPVVKGVRKTNRKKLSRMRRTIASRLVEAKNETAMLTTFNEVDLSAIIALRKKYQEKFVEKYDIKLGFMSLFAKACSMALLEYPDVNAMLDENEILYHDYVDISIAISTDTGLVVPPLKNVESLSFAEIEMAIKELALKARDNKLTLEEMSGGTFTITNGGIFGSMMSTPILNRPQSAILGMHNIIQRPIAVNGEVVIRPMMYLALSYDHRVIDGSTSVTFLVRVKELLEDPIQLLLEL